MKYFTLLLSLTATILLTLFLNGNIWNGTSIPPIGKLLNPFSGIWQNAVNIKREDQLLSTTHIGQDVHIILDQREVPHIYADNISDAIFAQGYMVGKHRYFQMDMMSRAASGRIAEIAGPARLNFDITQRRKGMTFAAKNAMKGWKKFPESYALIETYVAGVNKALSELTPAEYPLEYKLLNIEPEPWSVYKTILIVKTMAYDLAGRDQDIASTNMLSILGKEEFFTLYDEHENIETPIIADEYLPTSPNMKLDTNWNEIKIAKYYNTDFDTPIKGIGSNNWAVDGSKTRSGKPIFSSDPHLVLSLPSIWYETHLQFDKVNAYGVTIPGMPGLMMGWNNYIAWGETNVGQDIKDYYNIEWVDPTRNEYWLDGKKQKTKIEVEEYYVKGRGILYDTMRYTIHGPVLYDSEDGTKDLAIRWLSHDEPKSPEMMTFVDGLQSTSYDEYLKATEVFVTPAQNFLAADNNGILGLRVNGLFPKKSSQDGRFVKNGDQSKYMWQDYIPRTENPQLRKPKKGYIASSNQVSASEKYPYYFTGIFEHFRNKTIDSLLAPMANITPTDMMEMQQNTHSYKAKKVLPILLEYINIDEGIDRQNSILTTLNNWNYNYDSQLLAPTYFEIWWNHIYHNTWDEFDKYVDSMQVLYPDQWKTIEYIVNEPNHKYFDIESTPESENIIDIIKLSYQQMQADVKQRQTNGDSNKWNDYSPMNIYHLLRIPALSRLNILHTGCGDAINASRNNLGPSWRMVVDLNEKPIGFGVYPGGQSGNPLSKHYDDGIELWEHGKYHTIDINQSTSDWKNGGYSINIKAKQ